jgi:hypothetical protein
MHVELCVLLCVLQIVALSDGVMVARGDLGVEMNPWDVPVLQKRIVETCKFLGKPVVSVHFTFLVHVATTRAVCQMPPALTGNFDVSLSWRCLLFRLVPSRCALVNDPDCCPFSAQVIATQMMESMIDNPTPTRAEASDTATAIYDRYLFCIATSLWVACCALQ